MRRGCDSSIIFDIIHSFPLPDTFSNKPILPSRIDITFDKHNKLYEPFEHYILENDHEDDCYCACCRMCCHCCKRETVTQLTIEYFYNEKLTNNLIDIPVQKSIHFKNLFAYTAYENAIQNVVKQTFENSQNGVILTEEFKTQLYQIETYGRIEEQFDTINVSLTRPFVDFPEASAFVTLFDNYVQDDIILLNEPFNLYNAGIRTVIVPPFNINTILGDIYSVIPFTVSGRFVNVNNTQNQLSESFFETINKILEYLFDDPHLSELHDNPVYTSLYLSNQFKSGFLEYIYTPPTRHEIIFIHSNWISEPFELEYDDCYCPPCPHPEDTSRNIHLDHTFDNNFFFDKFK